MGAVLALTLVLHGPSRASISPEHIASAIFASDREATNFSAHVAWSITLPLAGYAADGNHGLYIAGGAWLAYSLVNEYAMHGPEGARERRLDLLSRLVPCAAVIVWRALR
jgi:hypothetical protein